MEGGFKNVRPMIDIQFYANRFIFIPIVVAVYISCVGAARGEGSSRTTFEKNQTAIKSENDFGRLPLCTLNLRLTGVLKGKGKDIALIRVEERRDKLFVVGEAISPNVTLLTVDSFGAVISHDGARERLEFDRKANEPSAPIRDAQVVEATSPNARLFESGLIVAFIPAGAVQYLGNNTFIVKRGLIQDQVRSGDFFANAKLEPDNSGGFHVTEIIPGSLYDTLRLKDGDTISAINGKPFNSFVDLSNLFYEQQDRNKTAQIQVKRGGSLNNLRLNFQ